MVLVFSDFPQALGSFRAPVVPPDVEPTDAPLVSVCFNYDWLPFVLGALQQLTLQATWQTDTDEDRALAMRRGASLLQLASLAYDDAACPVAEVETPFWDDSTDVDDSAGTDEQIWYGEVTDAEAPPAELDFVENAAIWLFTGFIAYSGDIGAAIFFHTIAPKFVLAFKAGDVGEIIRIVIDSAEYDSVDTTGHAGEVVTRPITPPPSEAGGHDIFLVKAG